MPSFLPKPCSTPVSTPFPLLLLLPATGVGSWERPQLMEHGAISSEALCSGALPHSRQRHCPTLHPPAVGQIPALRKQRAAVPKISALLVLGTAPCAHIFHPSLLQLQKCCKFTALSQGLFLLLLPSQLQGDKKLLCCDGHNQH